LAIVVVVIVVVVANNVAGIKFLEEQNKFCISYLIHKKAIGL